MLSFIVEATNRPGELARVANVIAEKGINIEAFSLGYAPTVPWLSSDTTRRASRAH